MNKDSLCLCKCGHPKNFHGVVTPYPCLEGWTSHMPGCECTHFDRDNLRYLEQLNEKAESPKV